VTQDLELLTYDTDALFVTTPSGRLLHSNSPDRIPAPKVYIAGCGTGNVLRLGHGVEDSTAEAVERLGVSEPSLHAPGQEPVHLNAYVRLLACEAAAEGTVRQGLMWIFPHALAYEHDATLVLSGTPAGDELLDRLDSQGMGEPVAALGFTHPRDFWPPWCAALDGGRIASVAFAARLGLHAAETGVATIPASRGRGFAAAATAGWAGHPALAGRHLFYSTSTTNVSSQRVAARLGLRYLGASFSVD